MDIFTHVLQILVRLRYPVSMPEDISSALGIQVGNSIRFKQLLEQLTAPTLKICNFTKFMPREEAERFFKEALRKDRFKQSSLYSFYFTEGWLEFELFFDDDSKLRRLYFHHRQLPSPSKHELMLQEGNCSASSSIQNTQKSKPLLLSNKI